MTVVRPATANDVDAVLALWRDTQDVLPTTTDTASALGALLARDADALLVAEDNRGIAGTLIVGWDGWRGSLYRMAVRTDARRRGVARALVEAAELRLADAGCARITAWVDTGEWHAAAFWRACGYEVRGAMDRFVKNT